MKITKSEFGTTKNGSIINLFHLENTSGAYVEIIDFGPDNQFRRPRPGLHGGRLTEILEALPELRKTSTAPAREEEHHAEGAQAPGHGGQ